MLRTVLPMSSRGGGVAHDRRRPGAVARGDRAAGAAPGRRVRPACSWWARTSRHPEPVDPLEDWIRLPAAEDDLRVRVATLASRAGRSVVAPTVDEDGLLRYRGRWVTLSPVERALAAALIDRFNAVVGRDTLVRRAWPGGSPTRNALDVHMLRLRRRISTLGLEVRTVRARGYLLQALDAGTSG